MKVATSAELRRMDAETTEIYEMPGLLLMENAALRVVEAIESRWKPLCGKNIHVVCGKGNNGGDGLAISRHLSSRLGALVHCILLADPDELQGDAALNYQMACTFGVKIGSVDQMNFSRADLIVDALLGTGTAGEVRGLFAKAIVAMNEADAPIVSVDVPSGVGADTGKVAGPAVRAALTVTFGFPKYGLLDFPGAEYAGEVVVADIGMPIAVKKAWDVCTYQTDVSDMAKWIPRRVNGRDSNKGKFGHVMILAGSTGFVGAPVLVAEAAARMGAGLVTLIVPKGIQSTVTSRVSPVVMTKGLPESACGTFAPESVPEALKYIEKADAVAFGPGIGEGEDVAAFVRQIVAECCAPMVIDADALNRISEQDDRGASLVRARKAATVLTPHPGEMGRLLGCSTSDVQSDRRNAVQNASSVYGCVVLLKGARTLISGPKGDLYINTTSNPGMATGGAGDVLSGLLGTLLGQKIEPLFAAAGGAYVHGLAGDLAAAAQSEEAGLIATDIIEFLPAAIGQCHRGAA